MNMIEYLDFLEEFWTIFDPASCRSQDDSSWTIVKI